MPGISVAFRLEFRRAGATPTRTSRSSTPEFLLAFLLPTENPRPNKACFIAFDTTSAATRRAPHSDSLSAAFLLKNSESSCAALGADSE